MTRLRRDLLAVSAILLASLGVCATLIRSSDAGAAGGAPPAARAEIAVRVTFREAALPGARVLWHRPEEFGQGNPAAFGTTDGEGRSVVSLVPGKYLLVAEWRRDGDYTRAIAPGDRFAWFGGNPVYVAREPASAPREIFLSLEEFVAPPAFLSPAPTGAAGVSGYVLAGGAPVAEARVSAYLRPDGGFRDMGFAASAPTEDDGAFVLDLPPGRYYLVARKRAGGGAAGPLRKGDLFGYYPANPVDVAPGRPLRLIVPATSLKFRNVPAYARNYTAPAFVEGRILGRDGKPRRGVYAALYDNPALLNRPAFLSDVTGDDGLYRLPVPVPGRYYLGARSGYGGSPVPGDLYGRYEGSPDHAVDVRDGDRLTGLDIVVDEVR